MSFYFETISESRSKKLEGIFTDISDILELQSEESQGCIEYFNKLILNDIEKNIKGVKCWVAGGSIRDYFTIGKVTKDIDLYFTDADDFTRTSNYLRQSGEIIFENNNCRKIKYKPKISSDLEIIINPNLDVKEIDIDLIKIHSISPEICIGNFDFTVCSAAVTTNKFVYHKNFFTDLEKRNLKTICPDPESLLYRIQKYSRMGFTFKKEELDILTQKYIKMDA
jgi:hypothetical protein